MQFSIKIIITSFSKPIAGVSRESNIRTTLLVLLVCFSLFCSMVFNNLAVNLQKIPLISLDHFLRKV